MKPKDIINNYHYEKLSPKHDLSEFSCGVKDLDDFLKDDALTQQEQNLSVTYLAIFESQILGYVFILADKVECRKISKKGFYKDYPSIKIGRLAIDEKFKNMGLGNEILDSICIIITKMSKRLGVSFITVDAYCNARKFYQKNEFKYGIINDSEKLKRKAKKYDTTSVPMYKSVKKMKIEFQFSLLLF